MIARRTPPRGHRPRRPPGEDAKLRDRAGRALELRIAGATYRQIGTQLGVSEFAAYYDVQNELSRLDPVIKKQAERLRDLEARRLDSLTVSLAAGIRAGDPRAVMAMVRIMERRAKLFGLDAPTPQQVTVTHRFPYAELTDAELKQKLIESAATIDVEATA